MESFPEMHLASDILFPPGMALFRPLYLMRSSPGPSPFSVGCVFRAKEYQCKVERKRNASQKTKHEQKLNLNRLKWNRDSRSSHGGSGRRTRLLSAGTWRYPCSDTSPANCRPAVSRRPKPCRCCVSTRRQHAVLLRKKKKNL